MAGGNSLCWVPGCKIRTRHVCRLLRKTRNARWEPTVQGSSEGDTGQNYSQSVKAGMENNSCFKKKQTNKTKKQNKNKQATNNNGLLLEKCTTRSTTCNLNLATDTVTTTAKQSHLFYLFYSSALYDISCFVMGDNKAKTPVLISIWPNHQGS